MAKEKIVLAELDLDVNSALVAIEQLKAKMVDLKKIQDELAKSGQQSSDQYKSIDQQLKEYTKTNNSLTLIINTHIKQNSNLITQQQSLQAAISKTKNTENDHIKNNKELIELRKNLNITNEDYQQSLSLINTKIQENNKWLAENKKAQEGVITTLSDYKKQVKDSFDQINIFNGGFGEFLSRAQKAGGVGSLVKNAFVGMTTGIKGMGAAISANPIGFLLQILAPIIQQLMKFTPLTNAVEKAMAGLAPVIELATMPLKLLAEGITWVVGGLTDLLGAMSSSADEAIKLKEAEQELATQMALQESANEKAKQQIDELIEKSQDHSLSEEERAKAIGEATAIQKKNYEERKAIADKTYDIELKKLAQSKNLSAEEIKILEEGDDAKVQALLQTKDISKEELETLDKAKVEKIRIAGEEKDIKKKEAAAMKSLVDEMIQKSGDQSLSEQERIEALEKAAKIETDYINKRKKENADLYNDAVNKAIAQKGISQQQIDDFLRLGDAYGGKAELIKKLSKEEVIALQNAYNEKKKINDDELKMTQAFNAQKDKIEADAAAKRKAAADEQRKRAEKSMQDAIARQKLELDIFIEEQGIKAKSLQEELAFAEKIAEKKKAIALAEFKASKKTEKDKLKLKLANAQIDNDLARARMDATIDNAERELQEYIKANQSKLKDGQFLSEELYNAEAERLNKIAEKEREYQEKRLAEGAINQQEYNDEIERINSENDEKQNQLKSDRQEAEKSKKVSELAADTEIKRANAQNEFELQTIDEEIRHSERMASLDKQLQDKSITEEQYRQLAEQEENQHTEIINNIHEKKEGYKLELASQTFSSMADILGKESKAGKAFAIAQTTIDTYQAATKALAASPPPFNYVAAAAVTASGLKNVQKIISTKEAKAPKAEKGALFSIGGKRHSAGGTMFTGEDGTAFEAEQGELIGVMNRNAARHFMAFNNAFPSGGNSAPNYFASGGIVSREIATPGLNVEYLASKIAEANRTLPPPVVSVEDIVNQGNSYVSVREMANF